MAYYIGDKTYTDHPLMDEICYNCKLILKSIVIKNDVLANSKETENSLQNAEMLKILTENGSISFGEFYFSEEMLVAFGYTNKLDIKRYLNDKYTIPEEDREALTSFCNEYFKENFEEENDYYRSLMGLPGYNTGDEYYIYLVSSDIPSSYTEHVYLDIPLHEQPKKLIDILYEDGIIDRLRDTYVGSNYSYMMYLGNRSIDLYTARAASKWDILYMPNVYYLIRDRFIDLYKINRETYMDRSYQDFFAESGEYYDQMMILIVLAQTFADMITDVPEWYIKRDIFDLRSCKYFLESAGVDYFKEIPLKYQIRIVKNLNRLITYKSSNKNISDIIDIFGIDNITIYKYWLYKKRDTSADRGYSLEFIASKYDESYDKYIKDRKYRYLYDDLTLDDKYWDGEDSHSYIENKILDKEFTIAGTKYMSVEYNIPMSEYLYQIEYMMGLILDSRLYDSLSDIKIAVPSINEYSNFKLADLFLFLVVISNSFYRYSIDSSETTIRLPDKIGDGTEASKIIEENYNWMFKYYPELFVVKNGRIKSFNPTLDKDKFINIIERRHSHLRFGGEDDFGEGILDDEEYKARIDKWVTDLGIYDYIVPNNINTISDLITVYRINTKVYHTIVDAIRDADTADDKILLEYIFQELFTRPYDLRFSQYTESGYVYEYDDMIDILKSRDFILYEDFIKIMSEPSIDTKQEIMRGIMNDIVDTLDYYLSGDGLNYLYSFVSIESFNAIINYVYTMICFFKSYKIHFLEPYYTLIMDDKLEDDKLRASDAIEEYRIINYKWDKSHASDTLTGISANLIVEDNHYGNGEIVDIYNHYTGGLDLDLMIDGIHAEDAEIETMTDVDGGLPNGWEKDGEVAMRQYYTLNGGYAPINKTNMDIIDGLHADIKGINTHTIDGGEAYDPGSKKTDAMGSINFTYVIDGGGSSNRRFISRSVDLRLVGKEFIADIILSSKNGNIITIEEDGLYISPDSYCTIAYLDNLVYSLDSLLESLRISSADILATIKELEKIDDIDETIAYCIDNLLDNMLYVLELMKDDKYKTRIKEYIDSLVDSLNEDYADKLNPYEWEEI
jgi:hypothetical protein